MDDLREKGNTNNGTTNAIFNEPFVSNNLIAWNLGSALLFPSILNESSFDRVWYLPNLDTSLENGSFGGKLNAESIEPEYQGLFIIDKSATTREPVDENFVNEERLTLLKKRYTRELIALIVDEYFEYGADTKADVLVRNQMQLNALATKSWLNWIFVENFHNIPILLGILRIIARLDYFELYPESHIMAAAALSHKNVEVQECGVRAFESWGTIQSLKILENLKVSTQWLQEYIDEVISDLRKEYNVPIRKEN